MRNKLASTLLIASIFAWGIWCGGQVFNDWTVVSLWSASPPESVKAFVALPRKGGLPFFPISGLLFVVLAIAAAVAAWKSARRVRKWLALSAGTAVVLFVSLMFYLIPLIGIDGIHIYVIHDIKEMNVYPAPPGINVVISGHSHKLLLKEHNNILYLNPGSAGPRRFNLSVIAMLKVNGKDVKAEITQISV